MKSMDRQGVNAVERIVVNKFGWAFREQNVMDFGIDAEIEVANKIRPIGKMIAAQIKSGQSYFFQQTDDNITFYFDCIHKNYWLKHVLPVIILLYHPRYDKCYWEVIDKTTVKSTNKGFKILIPKDKILDATSKVELLILAYSQYISDLANDIDELEVDKEYLFAQLNPEQQRVFLIARDKFRKNNAADYILPYEYRSKEILHAVEKTVIYDINDYIVIGKQFTEYLSRIEVFVDSSIKNTLIIVGEAGIGKTTLVKTFMDKDSQKNAVYYIKPCCYKDITVIIENEYQKNNSIKIIIVDGWDEIQQKERQRIWKKLERWHNQYSSVKLIITSRMLDNIICEKAEILRMNPLSKQESLQMLSLLSKRKITNLESVENLMSICNTPLMLKCLVKATDELKIPLENLTIDNILFSLVSQHSNEDSNILESIAFEMMQKDKCIITIPDQHQLTNLERFRELHIVIDEVSFVHKSFFEIYAAKYIFNSIFLIEKTPNDFCDEIWKIFSNSICPIEILNYLKHIIMQYTMDELFVDRINNRFFYAIELSYDIFCQSVFNSVSNVFYALWHIVSYINRKYYGLFKPKISDQGQLNLSSIINTFNRIHFGEYFLDFSYADFSYMKLWRSSLINMNFKKSKLCYANLLGCNLEGSNLQETDLSYSNLVNADLRHTNLKGSVLTGANVSNCMISEDSLKYLLPYNNTLRNKEKLIVFMRDGSIKRYLEAESEKYTGNKFF